MERTETINGNTMTEMAGKFVNTSCGFMDINYNSDDVAVFVLSRELRKVKEERDRFEIERNQAVEERDKFKLERDEFKDTCASQSNEINRCKKMLAELQERFRKEEEIKKNGSVYPPFINEPNVCNYDPTTNLNEIRRFWNVMFDVKDLRDAKGKYIIKGIIDVVPIFLVVSQSKDYDNSDWFFCGTQTSFCEEWNCFVADRESNPDRRVKLTCKPTSFNSALSKITYDRNPAVWKKNFRDGKSPINDYKRIINIKEQIMSRWH